jgi:hypothetical protein
MTLAIDTLPLDLSDEVRESAMNLYANGYRYEPWLAGYVKCIGGGRPYVVNLIRRRCDCPATAPCKHEVGVWEWIYQAEAAGEDCSALRLHLYEAERLADAAMLARRMERRAA